MANKSIPMHKIRDIIKLSADGCSLRKISLITGIHRKVVTSYLNNLQSSSISALQALELADNEFAEIFKKDTENTPLNQKQRWLNEFLEYAQTEIKRKHVTRQLLYEEYTQKYNNDFYSYSQFCEYLSKRLRNSEKSLFQTFNPGEIMIADFAGELLSYIDKETGEEISCQVLIVTLGYSGYTYVKALPAQTQECFIDGLGDALSYFGGCPTVVRFDNLKAGVIKSDRYEPTFNALLEMFCIHNSIVADATRVRKPKDKAQVESHVNLIYQRIYAPLRNESIYSINELNSAIEKHLQIHNRKAYRGTSNSRYDFYQEEKNLLSPLPLNRFTKKYVKKATVQKNYHIWLGQDEHYYSLPYIYTGKEVTVVYDNEIVEIFCDNQRIAIHNRMCRTGRYSTIKAHMPPEHIAVKNGTDPQWLKKQAESIGPHVLEFTKVLLNKGLLTPQHFKSCQGVISLARKYPPERVNMACKRALDYKNITYKSVQSILEKNLDSSLHEDGQFTLPFNHTARGSQSYK